MAAITLFSASLVTQASLLSVKCPTSVFYKDTCRWMKSLPGKANTLNFTSAKIPLPNNHMLWELGHIARESPSSKSGFYWTLQIPAPLCKQPAISFAPQGLCSLLYLPNIPFTLVLPTKRNASSEAQFKHYFFYEMRPEPPNHSLSLLSHYCDIIIFVCILSH